MNGEADENKKSALTAACIKHLQKAGASKTPGLLWREYVLGTLAFVGGKRDLLVTAHCEVARGDAINKTNLCVLDLPDGNGCDEGSDCSSSHCQNNFCCSGGDCCALATDCPNSYRSASVCIDAATCQGTRSDATCAAVPACMGCTTEVCRGGRDEDCDGAVDEDLGAVAYFPDCDGDLFGFEAGVGVSACAQPGTPPAVCGGRPTAGWSDRATDCDDSSATQSSPKEASASLFDGRAWAPWLSSDTGRKKSRCQLVWMNRKAT